MDITKTEDEARSILFGENGWKVIEDTVIDQDRWNTIHNLVVKSPDGKFYKTTYGIEQDTEAFEYQETVTFVEVNPYLKIKRYWGTKEEFEPLVKNNLEVLKAGNEDERTTIYNQIADISQGR